MTSTASTVAAPLAQAVGMAAVVLGVAVFLATRHVRSALGVLLDLLLAAGLLRLGTDQSWSAIASAAALVVVRKLAMSGVTTASRSREGATT
ncbi:MAG TPA: hypothetical protein VFK34_10380 [Marmoricola sp.]|jgi:hypothetical protein|nr:hypothetical protein [Marmoricola sp.]